MNRRPYNTPLLLISLFLCGIILSYSSPVPQAQTSRPINCSKSVVVNISTATTTRLITNDATTDSSASINICSVNLTLVGTATANQITFQYGTGATCGTGTTALSGPFTTDATAGVMKPLTMMYPFAPVPVNKSLCVLTSQAGVVAGSISYDIF